MIDATVSIRTTRGERTALLSDYLDPADEEASHQNAYSWIKQLRYAKVDGRGLRQRFTMRGDSLWWFTELYLHKEQAIVDIFRANAAARALIAREQPTEIRVAGSAVERHVVTRIASASGLLAGGNVAEREWNERMRRLRRRAAGLTFAAWTSRLRSRRAADGGSPRVAAFIHRAFWRAGGDDGSAESYIGPVLRALEEETQQGGVRYVGVGPPVNFRARQWWTPVAASDHHVVVPIERYAPWRTLRDSRNVWKDRHSSFETICASEDIRHAAGIAGIDCWPIVREQLAGVVYLQWPWSARAMDEAAAALDALRPSSILTYAEAGGWGRALILESRRRGIPSAGLQHGFIYRQWLNYLHEPDEMEAGGRADAGFPAPSLTLLFDEYAAAHLRTRGRFAEASLKVTGSPRLDVLITRFNRIGPDEIARIRGDARAVDDELLVLVTTKEKEARHVLPSLVRVTGTIPAVRLVIKPHPAETVDAYERVAGERHVSVVPPGTDLAGLLAASRAVVTVNSTVALDAAVLGIPALVVGLPNNLSPFVEAGALAGAQTELEIREQLQRILYDEGFRQQLAAARRDVLGAHAITAYGTAATRTAEAVLQLSSKSTRTTD
jgi:hypothetical protein